MAVPRYVKFVRGTQEMFDELTRKDADTLYFVYEDANAEKGKLYLGNKLISNSPDASGIISLSDIRDIVIERDLCHGDLLVYNDDLERWEPCPITEAIERGVMIGATEDKPGSIGFVPAPAAGDQLKFLRGDGQWSEVDTGLPPEAAAILDNLQQTVSTLVGEDDDKSVSEIAVDKMNELLIPENAQEDLDTIQEIGVWIQNQPGEIANLNDQLSALQTDVGIIQTKVGNLEDLLNDPQTGLTSRVVSLENTMGNFTPVVGKYLTVGSAISYLDDFTTTIDQHLRWHDLTDDTDGI